ncbi:hypothetical protein [Enterococcus sp. CWB-B31]|uniref:hypothetical protein n=1 Tax=Enterococcus sp. CWB-B31 TaxID=2885159 RepID=UPI001E407FC6|nr:hypothetical protein [Enterococcus sp. CWB-B31]MCB5955156.1 hypothetical protein [Enterococcus sp. CWB-B31]
MKIRLSDAPVISRKLSGILFFMYVSLSDEAKFVDVRSRFFVQVAEFEEDLDKIFGVKNAF